MKISTEFTDSQRIVVNILSYCPISLASIEKDESGKYHLESSSRWRTILYLGIALNTYAKLVYLVLLVLGCFGPVEFLDKMCALLWILMCGEITQELLFWLQTYPLYEVLASIYTLENSIYNKLGKPTKYMQKCQRTNINTLLIHAAILIVGCIFIGVQFRAFPKYSVYTYAAFKEENDFLLLFFTFHEVCFMWQAWTGYLSVVTLSCLNAVELTCIMDAMAEGLARMFPTRNKKPHAGSSISRHFERPRKNSHGFGEFNNNKIKILDVVQMANDLEMDPTQICPGTAYIMEELIEDYKKLMLTSDLLNDWCGYRIVGVHCIGYCQFISDVFMMIQLLRLPDIDFASTLWFGEDSLVCLYMMFRVFSLMSRVAPASENFMREFQHYLRFKNPMRKQFRSVSKTLRLVSLKLGPCPVRPATVGAATMMLMNYYLCVALWK